MQRFDCLNVTQMHVDEWFCQKNIVRTSVIIVHWAAVILDNVYMSAYHIIMIIFCYPNYPPTYPIYPIFIFQVYLKYRKLIWLSYYMWNIFMTYLYHESRKEFKWLLLSLIDNKSFLSYKNGHFSNHLKKYVSIR